MKKLLLFAIIFIGLISCNQSKFGIWEIGSYVDEFGEESGGKYVHATIEGTFSNSATTDSPLTVSFGVLEESIGFRLYEYSRGHIEKDLTRIYFKIKDSKGEIHHFESFDLGDGYNMFLESDDLKNILLQGGEVKFIGTIDRSEYRFNFNTDHLEQALLSIN